MTPQKNEVARRIERAGLKDVILHGQPHAGKTIIEKFEKRGTAAGFVVAVVASDDVGGPSPTDLKPRARQNVIGEMFWFAGRLGRERVCVLKKDDVAKNPPTALSQKADVGVKWKVQLGVTGKPSTHLRMLVGEHNCRRWLGSPFVSALEPRWHRGSG
jgi:hypothetical protein